MTFEEYLKARDVLRTKNLYSTTGILSFSKGFIDKKKIYQNFEEMIK